MQLVLFAGLLVIAVSSVSALDGSISVYNSGGYVAKFTVDYDLNGSRQTVESGKFSLGVTKSVNIPSAATNIFLKVEEYWFPGQLSTIFTESFSTPEIKCYKIWGTTLNPKWAPISC